MKTCTRCHLGKPRSEFYYHRKTLDNLGSYCKHCARDALRSWTAKPDNRESLVQRKRKARRAKAWAPPKSRNRRLFPEKEKARTLVRRAAERGVLVRPDKCSICLGTEDGALTKRGAVKIEAHHSDYNKPLDVTWCCSICHKKFHANSIRIR